MRLGVVCPLYVTNWYHRDFIDGTTRSITSSHEWVWLPVFNYAAPQFRPYIWQWVQHPTSIVELEGRQPQAVAKAWNDGITKAVELGCEYILVLNDDIVLKSNAIDNLVQHAQAHPEAILWSMGAYNDREGLERAIDNPEDFHEHPNFSAFMVHRTWPETFGRFDENFVPAYHEDSSCHAQIALAGQRAYVTGGAWFYHYGSRTINSDEAFRSSMPSEFVKGAQYFQHKWGTGVLSEADQMREQYYQHPYNIPELALHEWIPDYWDFLARHNVASVHNLDKQVVLDYLKERGLR
jgi:hypothetical protein